jgi:hypothetical protein
MNLLMIIYLTIVQLVRQAWALPQTVLLALTHKRRATIVNEHEVERLDRLRNPSKYQGR